MRNICYSCSLKSIVYLLRRWRSWFSYAKIASVMFFKSNLIYWNIYRLIDWSVFRICFECFKWWSCFHWQHAFIISKKEQKRLKAAEITTYSLHSIMYIQALKTLLSSSLNIVTQIDGWTIFSLLEWYEVDLIVSNVGRYCSSFNTDLTIWSKPR